MDTDSLLMSLATAENQLVAWQRVVEANTGAFREIRLDLGDCNNQQKVQAIINKVEMALQDLCFDSQKIPGWVKQPAKRAAGNVETIDVNPNLQTVVYGQYPVHQPLNPDNPVPWAPGYTPSGAVMAAETPEEAKKAKR